MPKRRRNRNQSPPPLDAKTLRTRLVTPTIKFAELGQLIMGKRGGHVFIDNGRSVLAVAHLDSVSERTNCMFTKINGQNVVFSIAVDDRLGAYVILDLLPALGLCDENGKPLYDILLTDGEETGFSTAADFQPPKGKKYNWMFMFDRMGTDVVMYEYETPALTKLLKSYSFNVGTGSYTCIRELEHLKCAGFNFGTGYYENHGYTAHAILDQTLAMASNFAFFFMDNYQKRFAHKKTAKTSGGRYYFGANYAADSFQCVLCSATAHYRYEINGYKNVCYRCYFDLIDKRATTARGAESASSPSLLPATIKQYRAGTICETCGTHDQPTINNYVWLNKGRYICDLCMKKEEQQRITLITTATDDDDSLVRCDVCGDWVNVKQASYDAKNKEYWCNDCIANHGTRLIEQGRLQAAELKDSDNASKQ